LWKVFDRYLIIHGFPGEAVNGALAYTTDACVITTARDAADRGYNCVVVEDACASFDQLAHEAALLNFARTFGVVMNCDEVFSTLGDRT